MVTRANKDAAPTCRIKVLQDEERTAMQRMTATVQRTEGRASRLTLRRCGSGRVFA